MKTQGNNKENVELVDSYYLFKLFIYHIAGKTNDKLIIPNNSAPQIRYCQEDFEIWIYEQSCPKYH